MANSQRKANRRKISQVPALLDRAIDHVAGVGMQYDGLGDHYEKMFTQAVTALALAKEVVNVLYENI